MLRAAASGAVVRAGGLAARTRTSSNCLNTGKENLGDKVGGRFLLNRRMPDFVLETSLATFSQMF